MLILTGEFQYFTGNNLFFRNVAFSYVEYRSFILLFMVTHTSYHLHYSLVFYIYYRRFDKQPILINLCNFLYCEEFTQILYSTSGFYPTSQVKRGPSCPISPLGTNPTFANTFFEAIFSGSVSASTRATLGCETAQ